jgi:type IV pilus assembly protein PilQ
VNLQNDTLWKVFNKITKLTEKNFVIQPEVREKQLNAFYQNRPYEQVLEMIAKANGLQIDKEKEGEFHIGLAAQETPQEKDKSKNSSSKDKNKKKKDPSSGSTNEDLNLTKNDKGLLDVYANNIEIAEIIKEATKEAGAHYVLHTNVDGKAQLDLKGVTIDGLLGHLFRNSKYNYLLTDGVYIIGESKSEGVRKAELIRMENRTVENVLSSIPKELMSDVTVSEFLELNGLIVSGKGQPLVMIHASSSRGIVITEIEKSEYWKKRVAGFGTYIH